MHASGLAPKGTARTVGISVSDVTRVLNDTVPSAIADETRCWINIGWSGGLDLIEAPEWAAFDDATGEDDDGAGGLAAILIARDAKKTNKRWWPGSCWTCGAWG